MNSFRPLRVAVIGSGPAGIYASDLELLLKYDVTGQPTKEELKKAYEECYKKRKGWIDYKENYKPSQTNAVSKMLSAMPH